ncbi:MAG: hypothetical protein IJJ33_03420 [Victivallales bacterium]|nr:hypothetical protein [Victivallales bacterium]
MSTKTKAATMEFESFASRPEDGEMSLGEKRLCQKVLGPMPPCRIH